MLHRYRSIRLFIVLAVVISALMMMSLPAAQAQTFAGAFSNGFGAGAGFSQTVGVNAFTQTATMGNSSASAFAASPATFIGSQASSFGNAASFAQSISVPGFQSISVVQTAAFGYGGAFAQAFTSP